MSPKTSNSKGQYRPSDKQKTTNEYSEYPLSLLQHTNMVYFGINQMYT